MKKGLKSVAIAIAFVLFFLLVGVVYAHSVGISIASKIYLGEVKPNRHYDIYEAFVINTGDHYGCYEMGVAYHRDQPENRIPRDWIIYTPEEFCLEAGEAKLVDMDLYITPKTRIDKKLKGDYFSYLEACTNDGGLVGACAATKLYFSL